MRPPPFFDNPLGVYDTVDSFVSALMDSVNPHETEQILDLSARKLPPVINVTALALLMGYNPGFVHYLIEYNERNYREFSIPKGQGRRLIQAPKVGLKSIQKWLSINLARSFEVPEFVYGFVPGKSHVQAAYEHRNAKWIISLDIKDCFRSTPKVSVTWAFRHLGYSADAAKLLASVCCYNGSLVQGAPTSPVVLNIAMRKLDRGLRSVQRDGYVVTRYADDITISGDCEPPEDVEKFRKLIIAPWSENREKFYFGVSPQRLKVYGFCVGNGRINLTKGYRNRLRMMRYMLDENEDKLDEKVVEKFRGHLAYADFVAREIKDKDRESGNI